MSVKILVITAVAVLGAIAAVSVLSQHNNQTNTEHASELKKLNEGVQEVNYQMLYLHYKKTHNLSFGSAEDEVRFQVFKTNCNKILAHNANKNSTYRLGLTSLAHLTVEEFSATRLGYSANKNSTRSPVTLSTANLADAVDWTTKGAVTPVKNQGSCGSCWSFSATGSIEGAYQIANGELKSVSEQQLVDCSTDAGNMGCNGGLMDYAFQWVISNKGIAAEGDYPYTAVDGTCKTGKAPVVTISSFQDVTPSNPDQLKAAIAQQPVSVAIEADTYTFQLYTTGVITGEDCGTQLDHGVLAVGYGTEGSQEYIKVKNSWGDSWGSAGYVLIGVEAGSGVCGINLDPSYPVV